MPRQKLTLFDLDNTLLTGDSDVLWCDFLIKRGILDREEFSARNADMDTRYKAGTVRPREFSDFYVGTLAGRTKDGWQPLRQQFLDEEIIPRIPESARQLVRQHQDDGTLIAITTATNRFITELTARHLNVEHLIATDVEIVDGVFTGRTNGQLNMREGKVVRLFSWLAARGATRSDFEIAAYSDSINDLPLLLAVDLPVAVNPDEQLAQWALVRGHTVLHLL
jgi:HAD superfamily hydrolase (TIGR01490 family)